VRLPFQRGGRRSKKTGCVATWRRPRRPRGSMALRAAVGAYPPSPCRPDFAAASSPLAQEPFNRSPKVKWSVTGGIVNWKSIGLHAALVLVAWFVGSGVFGFIPMFVAPAAIHDNWALYQKAANAYEVFGIWVVYRIGALLFRFPPPRGIMLILIRLTWCFFAYGIAGGTAELLIGHPTLVAGLAGIPLAIVVFFLPWPKSREPEKG
jgi:hypothetical protein